MQTGDNTIYNAFPVNFETFSTQPPFKNNKIFGHVTLYEITNQKEKKRIQI
jgi:hypothetical protein